VRRHRVAGEDGDAHQRVFMGDDRSGRAAEFGGDGKDCAGMRRMKR
jgi:hypothetical protein